MISKDCQEQKYSRTKRKHE